MSGSAVTRPGTVTVVVVLTWINAVLYVIGGIALLVLSGDDESLAAADISESTARTLGITWVIIGLIAAFVAYRLGAGGSGARVFVATLAVRQILGAVWALFTVLTYHLTEGLVTILIAVIIIALLYNQRANEYFTRAT